MSTRLSEIYRAYEGLLSDVESEFDRVRNMFIDKMQCRKGCSSCCNQLFAISAIEAAYLSKAVSELEPEQGEAMRQRAKEYLDNLLGADSTQDPDRESTGRESTVRQSQNWENQSLEEHSKVVREALGKKVGIHHIPCPALVDDACAIYGNRPVMARKYGIPLWNPNNPHQLQACELNFKRGEVIEGDNLIEPQMILEYRWLEFKMDLHDELKLPDLVATVASAVVFDYQSLLEEHITESQ